jgi:hypothetical protein
MNVTRSLLDDIKTKQLQWNGQVQRMEEGRLTKEVIKWRPPGRRKRGRPKLTWAEGIRGLMGGKGLMEEDWNDRSNWRKKIIHSFSSLSYDRSKASSKAKSPHSAIQSFLFQMRVSSPFFKVIQ